MKFLGSASVFALLASPVVQAFAPLSPLASSSPLTVSTPPVSPQLETVRANDVALNGQKKKPKKKNKKKKSAAADDVGGEEAPYVVVAAAKAPAVAAAPQKDSELLARSLLAYRLELENKARTAGEASRSQEEAAALALRLEQERLELVAAKQKQETFQRALLMNRLDREERVREERRAKEAEIAERKGSIADALNQPKPQDVEEKLQDMYASISDIGERAFAILTNLGLVEESPDPESPDYDSTFDDELVYDVVYAN
ncbi:expressed unknown protein [Seminavis robusta]|uniref:Uncharacterized protein n=1 Tax=Seminavis robusta TaxID=568900 RepID=A0A9N8EEU4_9STRA|nr:expressed unknown protein [Seminavis robusta]|eukprot:Sro1020_g232160.1 n/a (258) ;mRNA; f:26122-26895